MQHDIQVLDRVKSAYATLRPSEQRVADQVLADPEKCTRCTHRRIGRSSTGQPANGGPVCAGAWL